MAKVLVDEEAIALLNWLIVEWKKERAFWQVKSRKVPDESAGKVPCGISSVSEEFGLEVE